MQAHLALCSKATLPILGMGRVRVIIDTLEDRFGRPYRRPLLKASRFLTKQPGGVSHLEVLGKRANLERESFGARRLIDLRCAHAPIRCWYVHGCGVYLAVHMGCDWCRCCCALRSLLTNLRKLTLVCVAAVSLPALQPIAAQLRELHLQSSHLQGSADGFLTRGWTVLTRLFLRYAEVESDTMTAALKLPALQEMNTEGFRHQGGVLQLEQLTSSCPNVRALTFQLDDSMVQGREGSGRCCNLQSLGRLTDVCLWTLFDPPNANADLDLPASLTHLEFDDARIADCSVDFFWALSEAAKCVRRGAHLRELVCMNAKLYLQPAQWGASLDEQYRRLGGQLTSLHELEVAGHAGLLLGAFGAVISAAPNLTCASLTITFLEWLPDVELPPICSASLTSIAVSVVVMRHGGPLLPPLVLTFQPECARLQEVLVRFGEYCPTSGRAVKIRCHCCSSACIVPLDVRAGLRDDLRTPCYDGPFDEVGVHFLPGPPPPQGMEKYTIMHTSKMAGPQQPLMWGHVVMPGFL